MVVTRERLGVPDDSVIIEELIPLSFARTYHVQPRRNDGLYHNILLHDSFIKLF